MIVSKRQLSNSCWQTVQLKKISPSSIEHLQNFITNISRLQKTFTDEELLEEIEFLRRTAVGNNPISQGKGRLRLDALICTVSDLSKVGWQFRYKDSLAYQRIHPDNIEADELSDSQKRSVSRAARYNNLLKPSTQKRVAKLESARYFGRKQVSIFSLMRDGHDLALQLKKMTADPHFDIKEVIDPYIQVVERGALCEYTGLDLNEIFWYFRQTWAIPDGSTPGRTLQLLIRDRTTEHHSIIGIGALTSAAANFGIRDQFIGWDSKGMQAYIETKPTMRYCRWINNALNQMIDSVYKTDFIADKVLSAKLVQHPTPELIDRLKAIEVHERKLHDQNRKRTKSKLKGADLESDALWIYETRSPLFRAKRAGLLAQLFACRLALNDFGLHKNSRKALIDALKSSKGRQAIQTVILKSKERTVGTAIAEISVCGAIQPYSTILGGKLVSLMMVSPEAIKTYKQKYSGHISIIDSSSAGKVVRKAADLAFLSTSSLYGRPNQYTRLSLPLSEIGGKSNRRLKYQYLGKTKGTGTLQFSGATMDAFRRFNIESGGRQVTGQFGEGASEKLRLIRACLENLGFNPEDLLGHGVPRSCYGIKLIDNTRNYLLGIDKTPHYFIPRKNFRESSRKIVSWWASRWLQKRLTRSDSKKLYEQLETHNLVMPICHGARVTLPKSNLEQGDLFS